MTKDKEIENRILLMCNDILARLLSLHTKYKGGKLWHSMRKKAYAEFNSVKWEKPYMSKNDVIKYKAYSKVLSLISKHIDELEKGK